MFNSKRYGMEVGAALALYALLLCADNYLAALFDPTGFRLYVLTQLLMLGAGLMAWAILRGTGTRVASWTYR